MIENQNKTAKFKLLCTYSHRLDRILYTESEKNQSKHISLLPSTKISDTEKSLYIIRHDREFAEMVGYVDKYWEFIDSCILFMSDPENNEEIKIGIWQKSNYLENNLS